MDIDARLQTAVQSFWSARRKNAEQQKRRGKLDAGTRGAVTAGTQMGALELLVTDILREAGLSDLEIKSRTAVELPGYYRAEKKWDLVVISNGQLVTAMEFKSQVGPSFGNNFNNRSEEVLGSATCIWTAFREGRFGAGSPAPFLGYLFLLEDCPKVHKPVRNREPSFDVDPAFKGASVKRKGKAGKLGEASFTGVSYSRRYELLCRRLVLERLYTATCFMLSTDAEPTQITQPAEDLTFHRFAAALRGHVVSFLGSRPK